LRSPLTAAARGVYSAIHAPGLPHSRSLSFSSALRPDIAAIGAVVSLFYALFLFQGYTAFFRDSDSGWHIRTGEMILRTGVLPHTDPYSFSRAGQPWFAWEWLADVLMGGVHQAAGLTGVVMLYGLAIAAGVWLWFRLNWDVGGNFLLACALASPMLSTCNIHWLARPHVISWLFFLGAVRFCEKLPQPLTGWHLAGVALGTTLWTNIHGSFFFAPLIPLLWAAGNWLRGLVWDEPRRPVRPFLVTAAVAAGATLLNPYGWQLHSHVVRYLLDRDLLDRVGEFESFNFHAEGALPITIALSISMAGAVICLARRRIDHFLLTALLVVMALRSARGLPLVALLALPLANGAITDALRHAARVKASFRRSLDGCLNYGDRLRLLDGRNSGLVTVACVCLLFAIMLKTPRIAATTGFPTDQFPVVAAPTIASLPGSARIFAPDKFGGYLVYKFNGERKVFFDGRSDFYGAGFLKDYGRIVQVRPDWQSLFDPYRFTHALLPNNYSLIGVLKQQGWKQMYSDSTVTLLKSPGQAPVRAASVETN
jgi:hypothetical protein